MAPKISVIVPVYKCEDFIDEMLQSLLHQTLQDMEFILVDDGSPDRSGEICEKYAAEDKRIVVIHKNNGGVGAARNVGLERATGEYIGFCDSDDWLDLEMCAKMYEMAILHQADIVRCNTLSHETWGDRITWCPDYTNQTLDGNFIKSKVIPLAIAPENEGEFNKRLLKGCVCCIFRHGLLSKHHIRFKDFKSGEDFIFITEAMWNADTMVLMKEPFYHYRRQTSGSLSLSMKRFRNYQSRYGIRDIIRSIVKDSEYYPIYQKRWEQEDRRYIYLDCRIASVYNPSNDKKEKINLIKEVLNSTECKEAFSKPVQGRIPFQLKVLYYLISHKHPKLLYHAINYKFNKKDE